MGSISAYTFIAYRVRDYVWRQLSYVFFVRSFDCALFYFCEIKTSVSVERSKLYRNIFNYIISRRLNIVKKYILVVCIVIIAIICAGFLYFKVDKEVPESIIYEYFSNELIENVRIADIKHNYNSDTHIDTIIVTTKEEYEYGSVDSIYYLEYQYYSSDDLWELLSDDNTKEVHWNEKKLEKLWTGENKDFSWQVHISDFDFVNKKVTLSYNIRYLSRSYYNYGEVESTVNAQNITCDLYDIPSYIITSKADNNGKVREITIEYDLKKGIEDVYSIIM